MTEHRANAKNESPTTELIPAHLAESITAGGVEMVSCIIRLTSLGQSPQTIVEQAAVKARGGQPTFALPSGAPKPLTINAWSFVRDEQQYAGTYGMTAARATEIRELLRTDSNEAVSQITQIVSAQLRASGSHRAVTVSLSGAPRAATQQGAPLANASDGGLRALKQRVAANSALCGQYAFTAIETGRGHDEAYRVDLGGALSAVGQSKALAQTAARLIRISGRHDPQLSRYARCVVGARFVGPNNIPDSVWDGRLGPFEQPPPNPPVREGGSTLGGTPSGH